MKFRLEGIIISGMLGQYDEVGSTRFAQLIQVSRVSKVELEKRR